MIRCVIGLVVCACLIAAIHFSGLLICSFPVARALCDGVPAALIATMALLGIIGICALIAVLYFIGDLVLNWRR